MVVAENEQLFLDLTVFDGLSGQRIEDLQNAGYLDEECENTDQAEAYIECFVDDRSDEVIKTLDELGSYFKDKGKVMYHAGLKNLMAMEVVLEHLSNRMVIKRKRNGDYIKRNGINTP
ncbi:MAG: hypothetical protein LBH09_02825 [Peptococcaceae bacterium]|nr:hypothetical protein [Peptococcaceae bacterium]